MVPNPAAVTEILASKPDIIGTYSLGTLLWFADQRAAECETPSLAIAPILAFDRESNRGGLTASRSREQVQVRFEKSPHTALRLYLRLAGMVDLAPSKDEALPYVMNDLFLLGDWLS